MLADTDFVGLAAVIAAIFGGIVSTIGAIAALRASSNTKSPNGIRTGDAVANIAAAVTTPPGVDALGQVVSDTGNAVRMSDGQTIAAAVEQINRAPELTGSPEPAPPGTPAPSA